MNNNYVFKYKEIGLQPGEKLKETLKDKKENLKKISNEIFMAYNKKQNNDKFQIFFENLKANFFQFKKDKLIKDLKNISKFC